MSHLCGMWDIKCYGDLGQGGVREGLKGRRGHLAKAVCVLRLKTAAIFKGQQRRQWKTGKARVRPWELKLGSCVRY